MSKPHSPMTAGRRWRQVGGTLIEQSPGVRRAASCGQRPIRGIIMLGGEQVIASWRDVSLEGQNIIVVQTKPGRLGMYVMGQTFFSAELLKPSNPGSIRSVALSEEHGAVLGPLLEEHPNMEVVIYPGDDLAQ